MSEKTINKVPNVPNLRFVKYSDTIKKWRCSDFLNTFSTNSLSWDQLNYIDKSDLKNLHYGLIHNGAPTLIDCDEYQLPFAQTEIKNYTLCNNGDVIFADASEDTKDICKPVEFINISQEKVVSGLHTIHARDIKDLTVIGFKGYLFSSYNFHKQVHRLTQGTKIFSINPSNFKEMFVGIPSVEEQRDIVNLLSKIDKRISTQNKIIKEYKSYRNRILHTIYNNLNDYEYLSLNQVCNITTGKLDANAMNPNGKYKFFTCAKEDYYIDTYSFDGESLIISGNGEVGLIKYFVGKFDAYQRTYVLQNFTKNPLYIKVALEIELPKKLHREKNVGAMPYIVLSTLSDIKIKIPNKELVSNIALIVTSLDKKIAIEEQILNDYLSQKKHLLANMFI